MSLHVIWLLAACPPPMPCTGVQGCPPPAAAEIESVPLAASGIPSNSNRVVVLYCAETELPASAFSIAVDGTASTFLATHLAYPVPANYRGAIQIEPDDVAASTIALTFTSSLGAAPVTVTVNGTSDTTAPAAPEIVDFELIDLAALDEAATEKTYGFSLDLSSTEANVLFVIDAFGESTFRTYATTSTSLLEYGPVALPGDTLELRIRAMDAAGNVSVSTDRVVRAPKGGGGCGCATTSGQPSLLGALAALALVLAARVRR